MAGMSLIDSLSVGNARPMLTTFRMGRDFQEGYHERYKPPRLPIIIKTAHMAQEQPESQYSFCQEGSPWRRYTIISDKGNRGMRLAQDNAAVTKVVAIKQSTIAARSSAINLRRISHANLINLLAAFIDENVVYLAYEPADITLGQIRNKVELEEKYISYICREVLHGLNYLHSELHISSVGISVDNIFLAEVGDVKIANVGSHLLENRRPEPKEDTQALGFMMMEIMEPDTASAKPNLIVLMRPNKWSTEIRNFQSLTQKHSIGELLCHTFMAYGIGRAYNGFKKMVAAVKKDAKQDYK